VNTSLVNSLMNFSLKERCQKLCFDSEEKWRLRCKGETYIPKSYNPLRKTSHEKNNPCRNAPKSLIKYINYQSSLCHVCLQKQIKVRCNEAHLLRVHNTCIEPVSSILDRIAILSKKINTPKESNYLMKIFF